MRLLNIVLVISALFSFGCPDNDYSDDYESVNEINIINIDGTNKIRVIETDDSNYNPQFILGTDEIIYQSHDYVNGENISKVNVSGGQPQLLAIGSNPVINNDGNAIAFTTSEVDWIDSLSSSDDYTGTHLAVMNTDGTNKLLLTYPVTDSTNEYIYNQQFTSDGQNIIFGRQLSFPDTQITAIYSVNLNGELKRLFDLDRAYGAYPHFLPNSNEIIFNTGNRYHQKLLKYNITTGDTTQIVDIYECGGLDISPDGSKIVYSTVSGFHKEVFIIDIDGQNKKRLTSNSDGDNFTPVFSPDGKRIVFESQGIEHSNIRIINTDGSKLLTLTSDSNMWNRNPTFSLDGKRIVFSTYAGYFYYRP